MNFTMNTDFSNLSKIPLGIWILLAIILFTQAIWLFQDSSKRHANKWLWGIWGLIQVPTPLLVYFLVVRKFLARNNKEKRIRFVLISLLLIAIIVLVILGIVFPIK